MMLSVVAGDIFQHAGDVLICPANPWLNMSGGVNGEILLRCGSEIQTELHDKLSAQSTKQVPPGTIVTTAGGNLGFEYLVHAVAIDVFYDTNVDIVTKTLKGALSQSASLGKTVVMPSIATGYGRLPIEDFSKAFSNAISNLRELDIQLTLVLRSQDKADTVSTLLSLGALQ